MSSPSQTLGVQSFSQESISEVLKGASQGASTGMKVEQVVPQLKGTYLSTKSSSTVTVLQKSQDTSPLEEFRVSCVSSHVSLYVLCVGNLQLSHSLTLGCCCGYGWWRSWMSHDRYACVFCFQSLLHGKFNFLLRSFEKTAVCTTSANRSPWKSSHYTSWSACSSGRLPCNPLPCQLTFL